MRDWLRRLWASRKPRPADMPSEQGSVLRSEQFNARSSGPLEDLQAVDTLSPTGPVLPTCIPTELEMQLWIKGYLQSCPDMFDEGTLDYLAGYFEAQEQLWLRASETAERSALATAHRIRSVNDGHLQVARTKLEQLTEARADLSLALADLNGRLNPEGIDGTWRT